MEILLRTRDVAEYLKISTQQVRRLVLSGKLPHIRISQRIIRYRKKDIDNFIEGNECK